jgi:hypothetical protein
MICTRALSRGFNYQGSKYLIPKNRAMACIA